MADELRLSRSAKLVIVNPDAPTQVRKVSGAGSPAWVEITAATFSECVTSLAQEGSAPWWLADLPAGLDATRRYEILEYAAAATAFTDGVLEVHEYYPENEPVNVKTIADGILTAAKFASDFFARIWDHLLAAVLTVGSVGKLIKDNLDVLVSSRSSHTADQAGTASATAILVTPSQKIKTNASNQVEASNAGAGNVGEGDIAVDHNTGGADAMRVTREGVGVDNCVIRVYLASDYAVANFEERGKTYTGSTGRWTAPLMLNAGDYKLVVYDPDIRQSQAFDLEVA